MARPKNEWVYMPMGDDFYLVLFGPYGGDLYEIDLRRVHDSASALDWVMQVMQKRWGTPEIMYGLLEALDYLFGLQANACSGGKNKEFDPMQVLTKKDIGFRIFPRPRKAPSINPRPLGEILMTEVMDEGDWAIESERRMKEMGMS